ncbi:MAG: hypothetical protein F4X99_06965 [Gammaproteobacteria bacterium]|nr:hypothetical protein [Gammaproteobacteria bacterium]
MNDGRMPVLVINLVSSPDRKSSIVQQFEGSGWQPTFVSAYDGHDGAFPFYRYKQLAGLWWDNRSEFKPGAFCCYLSHAKCWRRIANGNADYALVLEDDVQIYIDALSALNADQLPDFDLLLVNQRTRAYLKHLDDAPEWPALGHLITRLIQEGTFRKNIPAPGADGYIVSKAGARKLLRMARTRRICMGVDYALVLHSLDQGQIDALRRMDNDSLPFSVRCFLANEIDAPGGAMDINTYIYTGPPLLRMRPFGTTIGDTRLPNSRFEQKPGLIRRIRDSMSYRD